MGGILQTFLGLQGQVGSPILPATLPNLTLWYNTDQNIVSKVTLNVSNEVTQLKDLSNFGHPANSRNAKYPDYVTNVLNGLNGIEFTASNQDNLDINPISWAVGLSGFSLYVVAKPTSFVSSFPLVNTNLGLGIQWNGTNWQIGGAGGVSTANSVVNNTNNAHIYGFIFDGAQTGDANRIKFRYDRTPQTLTFTSSPSTITASASTMYFCGNNRNAPTSFMDGYLFEVLIWTRALSNNEITGVENYIKSHWGI